MKIGIFGDSYSCNNPLLHADFVGEELSAAKKSWIDHIELEKKTRVANHSMMGSSLYYSYSQFKKYQRTYDKIIFIVTDWGRLWVPNITVGHAHIPGLAHCEVKLNHCQDDDDREVLQAAYDYYVYLENQDKGKEQEFYNLQTTSVEVVVDPTELGIGFYDLVIESKSGYKVKKEYFIEVKEP